MYRFSDKGAEGVVFVDKDHFCGDLQTLRQIKQMVSDPTVEHARIMPDCHFASSCCVGFTAKLTGKIIPRYVGGDIGCGISVLPLPSLDAERVVRRAESIVARIRKRVPMGDAMHELPEHDVAKVQQAAAEAAAAFARDRPDLTVGIPAPAYDDAWLTELCVRAGVPLNRVACQLGTLGGGNHFVEVGKNDAGVVHVTVHSGSRGLGQGICKHHQDIITARTTKDWDGFERAVRKMRRSVKDKKQQKAIEKELEAKHLDAQGKKYLEGKEAALYYYDMIFAQCYAAHSRWCMVREVALCCNADAVDPEALVQTTHNYIDFGDGVWRKGAVRAGAGELLVVALNMRDGVLLVRGKGNPEWNESAPHGAGRKIPRGQAKQHTTMREFEKAMEHVCSDSVREETLDESPAMYKDHHLVLERSKDTLDVVDHVKPILNMKGF